MIPFITGRGAGEDWICFRCRTSRGSAWRPSWQTPYHIGGERQCHAVQPPAGTLPDEHTHTHAVCLLSQVELGPLSHNGWGMHWFRIMMVWLACGKILASLLYNALIFFTTLRSYKILWAFLISGYIVFCPLYISLLVKTEIIQWPNNAIQNTQ